MRITTAIIVAVLAGVISTGCREEATPAPASKSPSPSESDSSQSVDPDDDTFEGLAGRWEHQTEDQQHSSYLDIEANGSLTFTPYEEDATYSGVLIQESDLGHFNLDMVADNGDTEINMDIWMSANGEVLTASIDEAEEIGFLRIET